MRRKILITTKTFLYALSVFAGTIFSNAWATEPFVGLQIQGLSPIISKSLGIDTTQGVLVRDVAFPGPASSSNIQRGDVIVEVDAKAASKVEDVVEYFAGLKIGTKVKVVILRQGKRLNKVIHVEEKPTSWGDLRNDFTTITALGMTFASLTDKVRDRFKLRWNTRGIVVSIVDDEKSAGLDLKVGDVVLQVNQNPIWQASQLAEYLEHAKKEKKEMVLLLIERSDGFRFVLLPVPH